jgi:hypothetical protein
MADPCDLCNGAGERFEHADDCDDDLCALNGDQHSCTGQVVTCSCTPGALRLCLAAMLRMIPDLCAEHDEEPCTDEEHNEAITAAGVALYGEDRDAWPAKVRAAAEGRYP